MIAWESAGSRPGSWAPASRRRSPPVQAADNAARKGMENGLQKVEVLLSRAPAPGARRRSARSVPRGSREIPGAPGETSSQAHNGVRPKKRRRGYGTGHRSQVPSVPPRRAESCSRRASAASPRSARSSAARIRPASTVRRIKQKEHLLQLREKQKAREASWPAREAVPQHVREGVAPHRPDGREPPADARDAARQRRLPSRLCRLARAGAAARPPRALHGQRAAGQHPELRSAAGRHRLAQAGQPRRAHRPRRHRSHRSRHAVAPGRPRRADRKDAHGPSAPRSTRRCRNP